MCNKSQNSCVGLVAGAAILGVTAGAVGVAVMNKNVRQDVQTMLADVTKELNVKVTEVQKALSKNAATLKEKSRETLIAELKETQKKLNVAEKKLS